MSKKIKLVLSGSGTKFPVFIGALRRLEQGGYEVEAVAGTSGGAIVAAGIASGYTSSHELEDLVRRIMPRLPKLVRPSLVSLIQNFGFFKTKKLQKVFKDELIEKMGDSTVLCKIITVNVDASGTEDTVTVWSSRRHPDQSLPLVTAASMSIPFVFQQVLINGDDHVDGGLLKNFAIDVFGDDRNVVGLTFSGKLASEKEIPWYRPVSRLVNRGLRLLDLVLVRNVREDIEDAKYATSIHVTTSIGGLDFKMTDEKITQMIQDGYDSIDEYLSVNGDLLS